MRKSWLVCVFLGTLAFGQAAPSPAPAGQQPQAPPAGAMRPTPPPPPPDTSASVPADAAVITVNGVCAAQPKPPAAKAMTPKPASVKTPAAECKTVITKAEFEKLANAVAPNVTPQLKRQLAGVLPRIIEWSYEAKKDGLDKSADFAEAVKFARMQILTTELQRKIQKDAQNVPESEIEAYYKNNPEAYEQYGLERLFVPRNKQMETEPKEDEDKDKDQKLTDEQKAEQKKAKEAEEKAKAEQNEQDMTKLADTLRSRAAAGEDFATLQKEAFEAAGMKISSPTVSLPKVRRTGLPPAHAAVFDLKAGDVSQVINDSGGHYIYKVLTKEELSLDQVKEEIHNTLQNQRGRDMMEKVTSSFSVVTNDAYFGPGATGPAMPGGSGRPNPRMPQGPMGGRPGAPAPQTAPQGPSTQPQAQPPAPKPN
jgi:bifunctional DNA-binding transcriptional regulator/antitoxin component of YhaV-PrlF toxin-antitoxin module